MYKNFLKIGRKLHSKKKDTINQFRGNIYFLNNEKIHPTQVDMKINLHGITFINLTDKIPKY